MTKFHISKKGTPAPCKATIACRLTPEEEHFTTVESALQFSDFQKEVEESGYSSSVYGKSEEVLKAEKSYLERKLEDLDDKLEENKKMLEEHQKAFEYYSEEKEAMQIAGEMINKGYIKTLDYFPEDGERAFANIKKVTLTRYKETPTPNSYLDGVEGPANIIAAHSLVQKFGPNKGKLLNSKDFSKKNLEWINDYKKNPEMLERDYNRIKENMEKTNKLFYKEFSGEVVLAATHYSRRFEREQEMINKGNNSFENSLSKNKFSSIYNQVQSNLERVQRLNKVAGNASIKTSFKPKPTVYKNNLEYSSTNIKNKLPNVTVDENGKINNVFLEDEKSGEFYKVVSIKDDSNENIIIEKDGKEEVVNFEAHERWNGAGVRATKGHDSPSLNVVITESNSDKYEGFSEIHYEVKSVVQ